MNKFIIENIDKKTKKSTYYTIETIYSKRELLEDAKNRADLIQSECNALLPKHIPSITWILSGKEPPETPKMTKEEEARVNDLVWLTSDDKYIHKGKYGEYTIRPFSEVSFEGRGQTRFWREPDNVYTLEEWFDLHKFNNDTKV